VSVLVQPEEDGGFYSMLRKFVSSVNIGVMPSILFLFRIPFQKKNGTVLVSTLILQPVCCFTFGPEF
jgi:hypothetical protein